METRGGGASGAAHAVTDAHLTEHSIDKYDDAVSDLGGSAEGGVSSSTTTNSNRKRDLDEYDVDDDDDEYSGGGGVSKDSAKDSKLGLASAKRARRHNWQPKYETEFGLQAIERDQSSGAVTLALCGFCKVFGRENRFDELLASSTATDESVAPGTESKKRRRRSLTTTKFFRAFRVDNIRSHLQLAHPQRWTEFELLPKHGSARMRFLQPHGELPYDALHIVDDVVLGGSGTDSADVAASYAHALAAHHATSSAAAAATSVSLSTADVTTTSTSHANGSSASATVQTASVQTHLANAASRGSFDYEKHLVEQLALEREKLAFARIQFAKDVELRERDLALREKQLALDRDVHNKLRAAAAATDTTQLDDAKFGRLADVLRDAIAHAMHSAGSSASSAAGSADHPPSSSLV